MVSKQKLEDNNGMDPAVEDGPITTPG